MELLVVALALVLGFVLGTGVGAARAFRLTAQRRAAAGASAALASFWPEAMPQRSAADILAGRVRLVLGGVPYDLPVLPRGESRRWLESLDLRFATLGALLDEAADDTPRILTMLAQHQTLLLEMLKSYDTGDVLPETEHLEEYATDAEILRAVIEVWRAANPLAATLAGMPSGETVTDGTSHEPLSMPQQSSAGTLSTSTPG